MITDKEKAVLDHLAAAWNAFIGLQANHVDERLEFRLAIHSAQSIIAQRVAARADPDVWANCSGGGS